MRSEGAIALSPEGVSIRDRRGRVSSFEWIAVERIRAYKLDLITTDDVCLEFIAGDRSYVADEETPGWDSTLAARSERRFAFGSARPK